MKNEWEKLSEDHLKIAESQDFRCKYCKADLLATPEAFASSEWDHFIPRARGGKDEVFVLSCHLCNRVKGKEVFETVETATEEIQKRREDYLRRWDYDNLVRKYRP
jgi:5-methylcytosine-specific restriction endonuclease McrA